MDHAAEKLLAKGIAAHNENKFEEAELIYQSILKTNPKNDHTNHNLGVLMFSKNKIEKIKASLPFFETALEVDPNNPQFLMSYSNALYRLNHLKDAEKGYKNVIKFQPENFNAHNNLGTLLHKLSRFDEAIECYKKAIGYKPDFAEAFHNMGATFIKFGRLEDAEISYKKATELKPEYVLAHNNLGIILQELGRLDEAIEKYSYALNLNPKQTDAKNNLIAILDCVVPSSKNIHSIIKLSSDLKNIRNDFTLKKGIKKNELTNLFKKCNKIIQDNNEKLITNQTQIYRRNSINLGCKRHKQIFNEFNIIPKACFDCFKIQIEPKNVLELFKLFLIFDKFVLPKNNTRKCMVELRSKVSGTYKGLIYCSSIKETNEILEIVSPIINKLIISKIKVKRGCTEYVDSFPNYKETNKENAHFMTYKDDWYKKEKIFDLNNKIKLNNQLSSLRGIHISDILIINNWLNYAKKIEDKSYKVFGEDAIYSEYISQILEKQLIKRKKEFSS